MAIGRRNWLELTFQNISRDAWNKHSSAAFGREMPPQYRCTLADSKAGMLSIRGRDHAARFQPMRGLHRQQRR